MGVVVRIMLHILQEHAANYGYSASSRFEDSVAHKAILF